MHRVRVWGRNSLPPWRLLCENGAKKLQGHGMKRVRKLLSQTNWQSSCKHRGGNTQRMLKNWLTLQYKTKQVRTEGQIQTLNPTSSLVQWDAVVHLLWKNTLIIWMHQQTPRNHKYEQTDVNKCTHRLSIHLLLRSSHSPAVPLITESEEWEE